MPSSVAPIRLVVGLGNPGAQYAKTRHNVGFWFLDRLASLHGIALRADSRFGGEFGRLREGDVDSYLLKPLLYMNRSGHSVAAAARYYGIEPLRMLVVHDELDLAPGVVRLKCGGGHGGNNGVRDILNQLGTGDFLRLRFGVGHPGARDAVTPFLLSRPSEEQNALIDMALERGLQEAGELLQGKLEGVMNRLHSWRSPEQAAQD
ncbi:MAG: aminoacyl-tRNA hydrolase [Gammaproteobacteria bacterium]